MKAYLYYVKLISRLGYTIMDMFSCFKPRYELSKYLAECIPLIGEFLYKFAILKIFHALVLLLQFFRSGEGCRSFGIGI